MELIRKLIFILLKKPVHLFVHHKFNLHCTHNDLAREKGAALIGHHVTNYDPIITNITTVIFLVMQIWIYQFVHKAPWYDTFFKE
jgi:hypothetical protein